MSKKSMWLGALAFVVIVGSCNAATDDDPGTTPAAGTATTPTYSGELAAAPAPSAAPAAAVPAAEPVGEVVTVSKVIDGDTFDLADGRRIRVLGIDSCEIGTYGGEQAKSMAESQLTNPANQPLTMTAEPTGDDKDGNDRLLRYVQLDGTDFGEFMVQYDHTGVYQGEHDASEEYVQRLYAKDTEFALNPPSGRECADPYPSSSSGGSVDIDDDDDRNSRDGSIIPACRHKWWC